MIEILVAFLGIALYLYVLLGGADFGAGIAELFSGRKGVSTISKAIAPVWEANHIWIILVVVILFNGFPKVYTSISTYLHIPLLLSLIGIIIRGTSFTFRYYDIASEKTSDYYSRFFRISSILTPFFFGIIIGAIISGNIPSFPKGTFYEVYVQPWLNILPLSTGLFVTLLFAWLASVYLIGEEKSKTDILTGASFARLASIFFILLIFSGIMVFASAEIQKVHLTRSFFTSTISIVSLLLSSILVPFMWKSIRTKNILWSRILAGALTFLILTGWFGIQFPVMLFTSDGKHLTVYNTAAPLLTLKYLVYALLGGIMIILPALVYLLKVFKFPKT